jgi:hypothetical protein
MSREFFIEKGTIYLTPGGCRKGSYPPNGLEDIRKGALHYN